ncbi:golgin subfamily A member 6-like protein 9 [Nomascus leucogenys]|uniref:golgin subfamily A member 6-like protein 9 n=1 Tax=Nomascus leucogenys TaxID=61853 RepID=UPI00122DB559|nr:golgin subfamily A member 6-like protein 9 [Nomascus leucogenys]
MTLPPVAAGRPSRRRRERSGPAPSRPQLPQPPLPPRTRAAPEPRPARSEEEDASQRCRGRTWTCRDAAPALSGPAPPEPRGAATAGDGAQLKQFWRSKSPRIPGGKKINGSSPATDTSGGYHSTGDSATGVYREDPPSATLKDLEAPRMLKEGKHWLQKLRKSLFKLKNQTAEPLAPEPPAGPSEVEQLKGETNQLRKELEIVGRQLQAEMENNQILSFLNMRQEKRLHRQEEPEWEALDEQWDKPSSALEDLALQQLEQKLKKTKLASATQQSPCEDFRTSVQSLLEGCPTPRKDQRHSI